MTVRIDGSLDAGLYLRAMRAVRPELRIVSVLIVVVAGLLVALLVTGGSLDATGAIMVSAVAVMTASLGIVMPRLIARQALRTGAALRAPFVGEATESGIELTSEFGSLALPWSAFHQAVVRDDLIVLLQASNLMNILAPAFVASGEEWATVSQWVQQLVEPRRPSPWIALLVGFVGLLAVATVLLVVLG